MSEKTFKSYDEQIELLRSRGVSIETSEARGSAKKTLQHEGYYNLINGYKTLFLEKDQDGQPIRPDQYKAGTTIDEIRALCQFDKNLRAIVLRDILSIETNLKTLIAYHFSQEHGHKNYLVFNNFDTSLKDATKNIANLFSDIQKLIASRVTDPSINHYLSTHGYIPLWVLNNILTLGNVSKFYSLMKQKERQNVSKVFGLSDDQMISILTYLSSVRNICAHSNRLYCYRTKRPLTDLPLHAAISIPRAKSGEYEYGKRDLFAVFLILKLLLPNADFRRTKAQIEKEVRTLQKSLNILSINDVYGCMGFPSDWKDKI